MALASATLDTGRYEGMFLQFILAFSLEEASTFGRGSSRGKRLVKKPSSTAFRMGICHVLSIELEEQRFAAPRGTSGIRVKYHDGFAVLSVHGECDPAFH